jgi:carboxylate-amine ligase
MTVGLEEEVMVLDPRTLDLAPLAAELVRRGGGDPRLKIELPAAQAELVTPPAPTVGQAAAALRAARARLVELADGDARLAAAGAHPFAASEGELSRDERYAATIAEFGSLARRQLVFGLHVHVAVRGPDRALAVHNALRSYLPELAALAANSPFHAGADTGLASVRPKIVEALPRQGVPPPIPSREALAGALRWGAAAGPLASPARWWWELRLNLALGTVEVRVPDAQATVDEAAAVGALVHCLVARLAERYDAGEALPVAPGWRIAENRWWACRDGVDGALADLETGVRGPARERLNGLIEELAPVAVRLGCAAELGDAARMVETGRAARQREVAAEAGLHGLVDWLAGRFASDGAG